LSYGNLPQASKPPTAADFFASSVFAVLRHEHIREAIFVGHSMGVASSAVSTHKPPIKSPLWSPWMDFCAPTNGPREESEKFIAPYRGADYREQVTRTVRAMFPVSGTEPLREEVLSKMLNTPHYVILSMVESVNDPDQPAWDLHNVKVPLLVMNTKSPFYPPEYQAYARSLSARTDYRTFEGVGHFLMLEKPEMFNAALADMLREFNLLAR